jgi:hypothetical protein
MYEVSESTNFPFCLFLSPNIQITKDGATIFAAADFSLCAWSNNFQFYFQSIILPGAKFVAKMKVKWNFRIACWWRV